MEERIQQFNFEVKTLKYGQPRPYADSEYEYEITSDCSEFTVKQFCTNVLRPCSQTYREWDRNNEASYFGGYYLFEKIGDNKYRYYKLEPFTD